jgi:hypothetical protein
LAWATAVPGGRGHPARVGACLGHGVGGSKGQRRFQAGSRDLALSSANALEQRRPWRHAVYGMQGVRGSNPLSSTPGQRPSPSSTARESRPSRSRYAATRAAKALIQCGGHPGHHRRGRLPVDPAHGAAAAGAVAAAAGVAHQLIDHARRDGRVLQPGGEGVPQVMRAMQIEVAKVGPGRLHGGLIDPPQIVGG